jgi:hypothetical protein
LRAYDASRGANFVKLDLNTLLSCVAERYDSIQPAARKRKRVAELDRYMDDLRGFTLRRVHCAPKDKRKFTLQRLADELEEKHGRRFHRSAVLRALRRHRIYDLW